MCGSKCVGVSVGVSESGARLSVGQTMVATHADTIDKKGLGRLV